MKRDALHLAVGIVCGLLLAGLLRHFFPSDGGLDIGRYREARDFVRENYVRDLSDDELAERALHGMVEGLDRYSRYLGADQVERFERETVGSYRGIGVVFKDPISDAQVLFVLPDSPAEHAGIGVADRLLAIGGKPVRGLSSSELHEQLADAAADPLELRVRSRDGDERTLHVERSVLVEPSIRHGRMLDAVRGIGYCAITSFSHHTAEELDATIAKLQRLGLQALVIDLRGNPGGVLVSAVRIANRFIRDGLLVTTEGRNDATRYEADRAEARYLGTPLVLLVDGDSASASEVLAGALQDHRAAVLIGSATYGKGMVQRIRTLDDGRGVIKLTSSYYYTPAHRNLERSVDRAWEFGLLPDLQIDVGDAEKRAVRSFLSGFGIPDSALAKLREWERDEGLALIPVPPPDAQIEAALRLLSGELASLSHGLKVRRG